MNCTRAQAVAALAAAGWTITREGKRDTWLACGDDVELCVSESEGGGYVDAIWAAGTKPGNLNRSVSLRHAVDMAKANGTWRNPREVTP